MKQIAGLLLTGAIGLAAGVPQDGLKAEMAGKWNEAISIYEKIIIKKPQETDLYIRLSDIYSKEKQFNKAADVLNRAIAVQPKRTDLYARLASVYAVLNQPQKALAMWDKALELEPNNVSYLVAHARIANWLKKPDLATVDLKKAVSLDPANEDLILMFSQSLEWANKDVDAIPFYKKYLKNNPDNLKIWLILAELQKLSGDLSGANISLKTASAHFIKEPVSIQLKDNKSLSNPTIPILEYHCIDDVPPDTYTIATKEFKEQIDELANKGYQSITMDTLGKAILGQSNLPAKPVIITFDDGCQNIYTKAFPILKSRGYSAQIYIITDAVGNNDMDRKNSIITKLGENAENSLTYYLTWPEINKLVASGWTIGSHSDSHPLMSTIDSQNQVYELLYSKLSILANTGSTITSFAYPYGDGNGEVALHNDLSSLGYTTAVASTGGVAELGTMNQFNIPRVLIYGPKPEIDPQSKGVSTTNNPLRPADSFISKIEPNDAQKAYGKANLYSTSKDYANALSSINEAVKLSPNNISYLKTQLEIAGDANAPLISVSAASKIYLLEPTDENLLILARTDVWANQLGDAYKDFKRYLQIHNEDQAVWIEYIQVQIWIGKYAESMDTLSLYKQKFGDTEPYLKTKAEALSWGNRSREALSILNPKLQKSPDDYDAHYTRAVAYNNNFQPIEAISELKTVKTLRPDAIEENSFLEKYITTKFRPSITAGFEYSSDSYDVSDRTLSLEGEYFLSPLTSLSVKIQRDDLRATTLSGYAQDNGQENASYTSATVGINHRFSPNIELRATLGGATTENNNNIVYSVGALWTPLNTLSVDLSQRHDYYIVSPRTLGRGIRDDHTQLKVVWEPNMKTNVNLTGTYDTLSDSNQRWSVELNPVWEISRTQYWNFDVGPDVQFYGYDKQYDDHGYYSPKLIQEYYLSGYINWKKSDNDGVNLVLSAGAVNDSYAGQTKPSCAATLEGVFGLYRDWLIKASTSIDYTPRFYDQAYTGTNFSLFITRRF